MFLLAMKGLHVQPDVKLSEYSRCVKLGEAILEGPDGDSARKGENKSIGVFNQSGDIYLFEEDI